MDNINLQIVGGSFTNLVDWKWSIISMNGADKVLTWEPANTGSAKLQSADSPDGTYADVDSASRPYTIPSGAAQKYYRTLWSPPPQ